ncbi:MAG: hypothetical protein JHD16_05935 [Solirubrobacteraceae bacterium]|nr:hypothetical protein [Solirubrobacteraceae bacterium]
MRSVPPHSPTPKAPFLRRVAATVFGIAVLVVPAPAMAAPAAERLETPIASASTQSDVAVSLVKLRVPLIKSTAAHPEACDWIQYVRFRSFTGPTDPMQASSVAVLMPGILEGAMALEPLARNAVREAKRRGRDIEVWALDRRGNCLEDLTGLNAYEASGNFTDATDYYFRGATINGRKFKGFKYGTEVLRDIGLAQTVNDYYSVMTNELPDQAWREQHVICGGHSLGGPLTQVFAGWDFDGKRETTTDAGYRQCAAFAGFESMLDLDPTQDYPQLKFAINVLTLGQVDIVRKAGLEAIKKRQIPAIVPLDGVDPISAMAIEAIGTAAYKDPDGLATPLVKSLPYNSSLDSFFHLAGSTDLSRLLFSKDSVRHYAYTNAALLGQLFDDNGTPISAIRASFGFFDNAKAMRRNRLADQFAHIPLANWALQKNNLFVPRKAGPGVPVTGWVNYDELGPDQIGPGLTNPGTEVTDAEQFARIQFEGPTNFTEPYFPLRVITDLTSFYGHDKGGDLKNFTYRHPTARKPRMQSLGGSGVQIKAKLGGPDPFVIQPGYEHVDAVTAAEQQNNGKPEGSTKVLVDMIEKVVPR